MNTDTLTRRGFLKIGVALVGSVMLAKYIEPVLVLPKARHDWVQQLSDFYIVRVPEGKTFAHEALDMPVLFIMG